MSVAIETRRPKPREPTGTQRLRSLAKRLAIEPRDLQFRIKRSQCVVCRADLSYVRRYFEQHRCCETCESKIDATTLAGLRELERYL